MTILNTTMPVVNKGDYIRVVTRVDDEDESISIALYPLRYFRAPCDVIDDLIKFYTVESKELIQKEGFDIAANKINYRLNFALNKLEEDGVVISGMKGYPNIVHVTEDCQPSMSGYSNDGYRSFAPGMLPPSASPYYH